MPNASLSLQKAVIARLKGNTAVAALVGQNVFDIVPASDPFPRITIGEDQVVMQRADCYFGEEISLPVHVWSRAVGFPEAKRIAGAVRLALHEASLSLEEFRLVDIAIEGEQFMRDPDGLTSHAVLTFRALTEPTT